jgi:hypothetical protein
MVVIALLGIIFASLPSQTPAARRVLSNGARIVRLNELGGSVEDLEESAAHYLETQRFLIQGNTAIDEAIVKVARPIDARIIHNPDRKDSRITVVPKSSKPDQSPRVYVPPNRPDSQR